ncbi:major pollen allergen Ole e 10-like isoform X2 [Benincasa hispida]|uniref:major pollen allergen Ole e 10-like isoform X2 n=1 Tax=Benincasa hispida TaxID=102211 RepID=UPI001900680D|nr:major pollen allergen Ole e 10-like isoform X2 [Benincasa hispida]XP_038887353.1 major pollen allergen Ole e 10-like isoform X2 [Benincasa hispida]
MTGPPSTQKKMSLYTWAIGHTRELNHENQKFSSPVSTTQRDITTPITTVPTIILSNPTASTPFINPTSTADTYSPVMGSPKRSSPPSSGASWCIASQSASQKALQIALDYACGYGGTDCSAIQAGQSCYNPNTIHDHASYAFNSYYQKNPVPNSCNFGGTAVITSTDPSTMACQYTSTSTSSSILNTTNSKGSTVFGAVPSSPSPSAATCQEINVLQLLLLTMVSLILLHSNNLHG